MSDAQDPPAQGLSPNDTMEADCQFAQDVLRRAQLRRQKLGLGSRGVAVTGAPASEPQPMPIPIRESNTLPVPIAPESQLQIKGKTVTFDTHKDTTIGSISISSGEFSSQEAGEAEEADDENSPVSPEDIEMEEEHEEEVAENISPSPACPSIGRRGPLRKLGILYNDTESQHLDSPVHVHSIGEKTPETPLPQQNLLKSVTGGEAGRRSRFSALAKNINDWEDDSRHITTPTSRFNLTPGKTPKGQSSPVAKRIAAAAAAVSPASPTKRSASAACLQNDNSEDSGGNTTPKPPPCPSPPKFLFGTNSTSPAKKEQKLENNARVPNRSISPVAKKLQKLDAAVAVGPPSPKSPAKTAPAPRSPPKIAASGSSVSVAARTRLFETSILESSMPKAKDPSELSVAQRAKLFERQARESAAAAGISVAPAPKFKPMPQQLQPKTVEEAARKPEPKAMASQGSKVAEMRQLIMSGQRPRDSESPEKSTVSVSRSPEKSTPIAPRSPPKSAVSPEHPSILETKRIRVSPPKPGQLYPSLDTETENSGDSENFEDSEADSELSGATAASLGARIVRVAKKDGQKTAASDELTEFTFSNTYAIEKIDQFIDEALEGQDEDPVIAASIMTYDNGSPVVSSSPIHRGHRKAPLEACLDFGILDDTIISKPGETQNQPPKTPLLHSVSVYRKQREEPITPRKPIDFDDSIMEEDENGEEGAELLSPGTQAQNSKEQGIQERVKKLQDELDTQYRLIAQASAAVNLAKSQLEFVESEQRVEAERALLIGTQKRLALANEISRLRTEGTLWALRDISPSKHQLGPSSKGKLSISSLGVQLKRDFVSNGIKKGSQVHHFLALLKYRDYVEASPIVSLGDGMDSSHNQNGILHFPKSWTIGNLEPDFKLELRIYLYRTNAEFLPHNVKYHIHPKGGKESKGLTLTPKAKSKSGDSKSSRLVPHSPAGPDAVCTPSFELCGHMTVDITNIRSATWSLDGVRLTSPLEGSAVVELNCSAESGIEQEGFLSLFNDVAGYGLWERRYCRLTPSSLDAWIYPEDMDNGKDPISSIPLHYCVTPLVRPASREICARSNSFFLVTSRPPMDTDENSLVVSCKPEYTAIRHLIYADSAKEREAWCKALNVTLANLRSWDPRAKTPDETAF